MYDPKTNKFPYPLDTAAHYLEVKKNNGEIYTENYPFIDNSKSFRFKRFLVRILLVIFAFPLQRTRMGFKVKGKENLKKHKEIIKKGIISVSNHVHAWDYVGVMNAVFPRKTHILAWDKNISGENGKAIRLAGGIPIPVKSMSGFSKMCKSTIELIQNGGWLHIAAEASMWEFYAPIRPFKEGPAFFAFKSDRPILPMAYSYREPGWIRKHIFKQIALFTLNIGEPVYIDKTLDKSNAVTDLTIRIHKAVCKLAGFKDGENIYPPSYSAETSKRIDYYTKEYGVGYKGSW